MNGRILFLTIAMLGLILIPTLIMAETICDVQFNNTNPGTGDDCYPSPFEGRTVTITGVVTGLTTNTAYDNFWIQEDSDSCSGLWSGIYVFDNSIHPSRGDSITLTGPISEYYGMTEIDPSSFQIHATGRPLPEPVPVTSADLAGGCSATGEAFEGVLVKIKNVEVTDINGVWYVSDDGGVTECQIEDNCFRYNPVVGQTITSITGLVTYSWSEYEINPRDMDDIDTSSSIGEPRDNESQVPSTFSLSQNYPNPFNPITEIKYKLPKNSRVKLTIYNLLGQKVATLLDEKQQTGYRSVRWDASSLVSGVYFCRLQAGDFIETKRMVLLK